MADLEQPIEKKEVKDFLAHDFWSYINKGGMHPGELTGVQLSATPGGHSNVNTIENSYVETMNEAERARYLANTVLKAIQDCTNFEHTRHQDILNWYYIHGLKNQEVEIKVGLFGRTYKKEKNKALIEFVQRFNFWRSYRRCDELPLLFYT